MNGNRAPIKKKDAKIFFRFIFDHLEFAEIELTEHFIDKQRERKIDLIEIQEVLKKGHVKKEFKPDREHSQWRWSLCSGKITIIFNFNFDDKRIVFITCWRGAEPPEGQR
jgi:hypothetical protein